VRIVAPPPDPGAAFEALSRAHQVATDDWIPQERYLGSASSLSRALCRRGRLCTAPAFLARAYVSGLRALGVRAVPSQPAKPSVGTLRVLHFGDSYIVASTFDGELLS
jgi:hypothetical protein